MSEPNLLQVTIFGQKAPLKISRVSTFGYFEYEELPDPFIPDVERRCIALLVEQFEESPSLLSFCGIMVRDGQEQEYILAELMKLRNIAIAAGDQLDMAGETVGEFRNFRSDEEYRSAIYFKIYLNKSYGEPETLITALRIITKASHVDYVEMYSATAILTFITIYPIPFNLKSGLEKIAPAGVKLYLQFINSDDLIFAFETEGGFSNIPHTSGFSETNYLEGGIEIGGVISELISQ